MIKIGMLGASLFMWTFLVSSDWWNLQKLIKGGLGNCLVGDPWLGVCSGFSGVDRRSYRPWIATRFISYFKIFPLCKMSGWLGKSKKWKNWEKKKIKGREGIAHVVIPSFLPSLSFLHVEGKYHLSLKKKDEIKFIDGNYEFWRKNYGESQSQWWLNLNPPPNVWPF